MLQNKIEFWIFTSSEDKASSNIKNYLLENYPFNCATDEIKTWDSLDTYILDVSKSILFRDLVRFDNFFNIRLVQSDKAMIFIDSYFEQVEMDTIFRGDFIIFASRHKSKSELPALLTHATGNWTDDASHGGSAKSISKTSAILLASAYKNLHEQNILKSLNWEVDLEVDHHGPTQLNSPLIFMELGSSSKYWDNEKGVAAVSDAILKTLFDYIQFLFETLEVHKFLIQEKQISKEKIYNFIKKKTRSCNCIIGIGFGGPHYAKSFSNIYLSNNSTYISHILPKYSAKNISSEQIERMLENTVEFVNTALIDWKGLNSSEKSHILNLLKDYSISIRKTKEFH